MRQLIITWACLFAIVATHQACTPHVSSYPYADAVIAAEHDRALEKCYNDLVATIQTTGDYGKAEIEYRLCANEADRAAGMKP